MLTAAADLHSLTDGHQLNPLTAGHRVLCKHIFTIELHIARARACPFSGGFLHICHACGSCVCLRKRCAAAGCCKWPTHYKQASGSHAVCMLYAKITETRAATDKKKLRFQRRSGANLSLLLSGKFAAHACGNFPHAANRTQAGYSFVCKCSITVSVV